jgi:hypothetical protein
MVPKNSCQVKLIWLFSFDSQLAWGSNIMLRFVPFLALAAIAASPASGSTYSARLAAPAQGHIVARELNWACAAGSCQAATLESRPAVVCEALAKRAGRIDSFAVDGRPFSASEIDKCNTGLKSGDANSAAAQ